MCILYCKPPLVAVSQKIRQTIKNHLDDLKNAKSSDQKYRSRFNARILFRNPQNKVLLYIIFK